MISLWDEEMKAKSSILRLETFKKLDGKKGIVGQYLDQQINSLSEQEKEQATQKFSYLVTPSGDKVAYSSDLKEYILLEKKRTVQ